MDFPAFRARRLRKSKSIRNMLKETELNARDFIMPLFVVHGKDVKTEIPSMPGQYHYSLDMLPEILNDINSAGIPAVLLFGIPQVKDEIGSSAWHEDAVIPQAIKLIKKDFPELTVITDVCICAYTSHGHCGIIEDGEILNDPSLESLGKMALAHAKAGADFVAPSDMMDGRICFIREALDAEGFTNTGIISYSTKFSSAFYGPFREAAGSAPSFGDRRSYQMNPANKREAIAESLQDEIEGADMLMVKPALAYLDIIHAIRQESLLPLVCYNVSGEYSMIKAASAKGWIDEKEVALEALLSMKRAGADLIITYFALEAAAWLKK